MTAPGSEFNVVFPLWAPVGGVIKIFDYLHHTLGIGFEKAIAWGPPLPGSEAAIREHVAYKNAIGDQRIEFRLLKDLDLDASAWVLFSEPSQHPDIECAFRGESSGVRVIHLVQNTRHANPAWHLGFPYLLLHRPITRLFVTNEVAEAVAPLVSDHRPSRTIVEGHDWPFFSAPSTRDPHGPLRVGYTTWKSTIGDDVSDALADDDRFVFTAMRTPATWTELRDLYHRSDVWLCAPGPEEGFYLPGLEAMAANLVVVSALVGGNRAYLRDGENCLATEFEDVPSHVNALDRVASDTSLCSTLLDGGHRTTSRFTLERERAEFADFIADLAELG